MQVIQIQFYVGKRPYQAVGVADSADAVVAALRANLQSADLQADDDWMPAEVLWDSTAGFTYDAIAPLVTGARDGADAGWLVGLIQDDRTSEGR